MDVARTGLSNSASFQACASPAVRKGRRTVAEALNVDAPCQCGKHRHDANQGT